MPRNRDRIEQITFHEYEDSPADLIATAGIGKRAKNTVDTVILLLRVDF